MDVPLHVDPARLRSRCAGTGASQQEVADMNRRRILVAYDGTEEAFWALQRAADAADDADVEIGIVTVLPPLVDAARDAQAYLEERGIAAEVHTPVGEPATEIARIADDGAYDMVFLGSRRDNAVARALGPRVSREVAAQVPVSVLIAR
jgi:nucleotide-binding universal stress UspA family protein